MKRSGNTLLNCFSFSWQICCVIINSEQDGRIADDQKRIGIRIHCLETMKGQNRDLSKCLMVSKVLWLLQSQIYLSGAT